MSRQQHHEEQIDQAPHREQVHEGPHRLASPWARRSSCDTAIGAVEVVWLDLTARGSLDPLHDIRSGETLTVDVSVDGLHADLDRGGKSWDRDIVSDKVLAQSHDEIFTGMVSSRQALNFTGLALFLASPVWRNSDMPKAKPKYPNRIKELRNAAGLTLLQVADGAGTTLQQIQRLERGERGLTDKWMARLAPALGVKPAALLADQEPDTREFAKSVDEVLLLRFWRSLDMRDKRVIAVLARDKGLEILADKPKKAPA